MESWKKRSLVLVHEQDEDEDANMSTFRRRNKVITIFFITLITSLTLLLAASVIHLLRIHNINNFPSRANPVHEFCSFSNAPACLTTLNPIITNKFITDPNQILALSLQTAAKHLINTSFTDSHKSSLNNCRGGLGRIPELLATVRVNPFVESLSGEQRGELANRIAAAEDDVESCLDDLSKVAVNGEMTAKLVDVKVYLNSAVGFVVNYARIQIISLETNNDVYTRIVSENMFGICMCGLQLLFIVGLFSSLFKTFRFN